MNNKNPMELLTRSQKNTFRFMKFVAIAMIVLILVLLMFYSKRQDEQILTNVRYEIPTLGPKSARPRPPAALSAAPGKITHFVFWAEWCEPCKSELPYLEKVAEKNKSDYEIQLVNTDTDIAKQKAAKELLDQLSPTLTSLYDSDGHIAKQMNVEALPLHVLVDREGRIAATFVSAVDKKTAVFEKLLTDLIGERTPSAQ